MMGNSQDITRTAGSTVIPSTGNQTDPLHSIRVNIFKCATNSGTPIGEISLFEGLKRIQTGASSKPVRRLRSVPYKSKNYNKIKINELPAITPAGTFSNRDTDKENLLKASGLACMDLDGVPDPPATRNYIAKDEYVVAAWVSPGNNGVKFIVRIPEVSSDHEYKQYYNALLKYFDNEKTDPANKDISRLCIESHDPDIIIKDFDKVSIFDKTIKDTRREQVPTKVNGNVLNPILAKLAGRGDVYTIGNRETYIHNLSCETNRAGIPEAQATDIILSKFNELPEQETRAAIHGVYERTKHEFNTRPPDKIVKSKIITAMERNQLAAQEPDPRPLFYNIINENEIVIGAGDTGVGKSLLAVSILEDLARKGEKVLYYDFELSPKQFEARYKGYQFNNNFLIADWEPDPDQPDASFNFETILNDISESGVKIVCIDNITALSLKNTVDQDAALNVMRGLKKLQKESGLTVLVLAHVPKRPQFAPLTINDLAGSKHLANFADSVFFINFSKLGDNIRYIKHIKTRTPQLCGHFGVVIEKGQDGMIRLTFDGYLPENDHLTGEAVDDRINTAANLRDREHKSQSEIAQLMKISQPTVNRLLKKYDEQKMKFVNEEAPF